MRLWSIHPRHLDRQGLVACWRESLLAQSVLGKESGGYAHHPQLLRFRAAAVPEAVMSAYLSALADEADSRAYRFDRTRIRSTGEGAGRRRPARLPVTTGQIAFERQHLHAKLAVRHPELADALPPADRLDLHPVFRVVPGEKADWER